MHVEIVQWFSRLYLLNLDRVCSFLTVPKTNLINTQMSEPGMAELTLEDIPLVNLGEFLLNKLREHDPDYVALVSTV